MCERRHLGEQLRLHVFSRDEHIRRLQPHSEPRLDEIFPVDGEQPELVPPAAIAELADELQALVLTRRDQGR
ncbi:MAG TPA: hypothetical protein VGP54_10350 [Gaiellaceae bacterium]|nr:hypothetical protein [Gaiellaceae bacterium]